MKCHQISLRKYKLLFLLIGSIFVNDLRAQTPVCNLKFDVFEFDSKQSTKTTGDIKAILTDLKAKRISEFSDAVKMPFFDSLTSGKYRIEVIKDGYQRRIKEFNFNCQTVNEILTVSKFLYLQRGNVKKVTEFSSNIIGADALYRGQTGKSNVNNNALFLAKPKYPAAAQAIGASGAVQVQVTIDEDGEITAASAISGHPLLRAAAETAASDTKFAPTFLSGMPVKVTGIIVYNFIP